ncbi:MAG: Gfo/Idh/MocA family oxidoreductase [Planctomycetaceae bacterium]|nr:Gfo/Idh/MocA family oxidoreductase [Planctomycetaceae bacterium]
MNLTPEQRQIGKENFNEAVAAVRSKDKTFNDAIDVNRRSFLVGAAAAVPTLGAVYFGYEELKGDPVRVGFIGTGDEGSILITQHPPAYMDIVAVADLRPSNLTRAFTGDGNEHRVGLTSKLGAKQAAKIRRFPNHRDLIKAKDELGLEAVVIAVPLNQHAPIAIEAMKAGLHVLSEKLMAQSVAECKEMIQVAEENKLLLAVGHQRHYSVLYDHANHIIEQGLLGDIRFIRAQWHRNNSFPLRDSWRKDLGRYRAGYLSDKEVIGELVQEYGYDSMEQLCNWRLFNKTGGGLMAELGSHQLDACSIFLSAGRPEKVKPLAVQGYGGRNFYGVKGVGSLDKQNDPREIDDHVYVTFEFPGPNYEEDDHDKVIVTYSSINTNSHEPYGETIFGSRATLTMEKEQEALLSKEGSALNGPGGPDQRLYVINGRDGGPVLSASESLAPSAAASATQGATGASISRGYTEEMEHFCHCIRTNNHSSPKEGGLRCNGTVAMADAIMALTSNLAMKYQKRIEFKPEWFDPKSPATPETDPEIIG